MAAEKFEFEGHGGDVLAGRIEMPEGTHRATALFAHCFTCGKDIAAARRIAQRLTAAGIAVLRFDFTGLGHSGGDPEAHSPPDPRPDWSSGMDPAARRIYARGR